MNTTRAATRPGRLALPAEGALRERLLAAFTAILAHALAQQGQVPADPAAALHELRKSVRRARALLRLMQGFVGVDAYGAVSAALAEVQRATSALRDRQVVRDALQAAHPGRDRGAPSAVAQALSAAMAGSAGDAAAVDAAAGDTAAVDAAAGDTAAADAAEIAEVIERACLRLAELPRLLAGGMPPKIRWPAVVDGLARSFRRARRRLRAAEQRDEDEAVHALRKRIKELDYQVELLTAHGGRRMRARHKALARLAEELGQVVDLFVLRDQVVQRLAPGPDQARLREAIADARARQLAGALAHARDVLDHGPRRYARRIVRAARRRRP
jgi:CHAD domain-containing protein